MGDGGRNKVCEEKGENLYRDREVEREVKEREREE